MDRAFRIVVVEDSETQAFKMRMLLEEQGWQVSVAGAAEAALAALGDPLPDLILVDYNLPGMRGDEFCRRIRMNLNTRGIPLLMMTGSAPDAAEISSLESGADDYISKSESSEILLLRIRALLRKAPAQAAILNPQDSAFRSARILTIDDSPTYLAFLSDELRNQGYEVETAASGLEGLSRLADERFDCVLVDLVMPEMDGIEVCRRIAAMRQSLKKRVAVIILTASANKGDLNRGLEAGADDFVSKSSDLAVLRARIQALMRRRFFRKRTPHCRGAQGQGIGDVERPRRAPDRRGARRHGRKAGAGQSRSARGEPEAKGNPGPIDPERKDGFAGATGGRNRSRDQQSPGLRGE
jgi:two-component system NtrC family sensor kinase